MTEPSYRLVGPLLSKSNNYILGPEAVINLINDGANFNA